MANKITNEDYVQIKADLRKLITKLTDIYVRVSMMEQINRGKKGKESNEKIVH